MPLASEAIVYERDEARAPPSSSSAAGRFNVSAAQVGVAAAIGAVIGGGAALAVRGSASLGAALGMLLIIETALPTAELLVVVGAYYFLPDEPPEDPNPTMPEDETGRRISGLGFAAGSRLGVR